MIYFGLHGTDVPTWLEKQVPHARDAVVGKITWVGINLVYARKGCFHVRPLFPSPHVMRLSNAKEVTISGQSPGGGEGEVKIHLYPIIPLWFLMTLGGLLLGALTK